MDPNIKINFWDKFLLLFLLRNWLLQQKLPRGVSSQCSGLLSEPFLAADQWDFLSHFPVLCLFISYTIPFVEVASFFFRRLNACFLFLLYGGCFLMVFVELSGHLFSIPSCTSSLLLHTQGLMLPLADMLPFPLLFVPSCLYCGILVVDNNQMFS